MKCKQYLLDECSNHNKHTALKLAVMHLHFEMDKQYCVQFLIVNLPFLKDDFRRCQMPRANMLRISDVRHCERYRRVVGARLRVPYAPNLRVCLDK